MKCQSFVYTSKTTVHDTVRKLRENSGFGVEISAEKKREYCRCHSNSEVRQPHYPPGFPEDLWLGTNGCLSVLMEVVKDCNDREVVRVALDSRISGRYTGRRTRRWSWNIYSGQTATAAAFFAAWDNRNVSRVS